MKSIIRLMLGLMIIFSMTAYGEEAVGGRPGRNGQAPKPGDRRRKDKKPNERRKGKGPERDMLAKMAQQANPVDRALMMTAQAYAESGDSEKAMAALDALAAGTGDANIRGLAMLSKARLLADAGKAADSLPTLAVVTGEIQPLALKELLRIASRESLYPEALAALVAAFKTAPNDIEKYRIINTIFSLAQQTRKKENNDFFLQAMNTVPTLMDRNQAETLKAAWQSFMEKEKAKLKAKKEQQTEDLIAGIDARVKRIEEMLQKFGERAMAGRGGRDMRNRRGGEGQGGPAEAGDNPDARRQRFAQMKEMLQRRLDEAEAQGNDKLAQRLREQLDRFEKMADRGKGEKGDEKAQMEAKRTKILEKIRKLEDQGQMDEAEALRRKFEAMNAKMDQGRNDNAPVKKDDF